MYVFLLQRPLYTAYHIQHDNALVHRANGLTCLYVRFLSCFQKFYDFCVFVWLSYVKSNSNVDLFDYLFGFLGKIENKVDLLTICLAFWVKLNNKVDLFDYLFGFLGKIENKVDLFDYLFGFLGKIEQ